MAQSRFFFGAPQTPTVSLAAGVGLATAAGLAPSIVSTVAALTSAPGAGLVTMGGLVPALLSENPVAPGVGQVTVSGLDPALARELVIQPSAGVSLAGGQVPVVNTGAVVEATAEPDVGLVTAGGLEPSLAVEYDKPRGHVTAKKRGRRGRVSPVYDHTQSETVAVSLPPELTPVPAAYWDPPAVAIAGIDTAKIARLDVKLAELESKRALAARRRREEEELIAILMRVA